MISIKPHHLVDIIISFHEECVIPEPHSYRHDVHTVTQEVIRNPDTLLFMELGADDICVPCIHNKEGQCQDVIDITFRPTAPSSKREYNSLIDERWLNHLDLKEGDTITARDFCLLLLDRASDITPIYIENPKEKIEQKQTRLCKGIETFLANRYVPVE
ncbi:hypothetical protein [Vibrio splendidus]|uniref:hypothetical protein n=1 Tax=Vibrio splendidus TaxID=29497 RepID=UPI003D10CB46